MWRIKAELFIKTITGYLVILLALFFVSWVCDKVINALIILMAYLSTRWVFPITYHAKTDRGCLMFSIACFSIAIVITLPITLSIISSTIIGAVISVFLFALQYIIELHNKTKVSDKEELIAKCRKLGYNQLKTDMAIKFFIENEKPREVWIWLTQNKLSTLEWETVRTIKYNMKKELFN
jgi:hypothetical protein